LKGECKVVCSFVELRLEIFFSRKGTLCKKKSLLLNSYPKIKFYLENALYLLKSVNIH